MSESTDTPAADWTAKLKYAPRRAQWLVCLYRTGRDVFAEGDDGRAFIRASAFRKRAEKIARRDLDRARELDRLPYRVRQWTYGDDPQWSWTPSGWYFPETVEIR